MTREFTSNWTLPYIKDWGNWLKDLIGKDNVNGIEIGCYEGQTSCWFSENILTGRNCSLVCIDSWGYEPIEKKFDSNTAELRIRKIKKYSYVALAELISQENLFYDFIYVDGNHDAHFVLIDMCMAWKILKKGGIMICDDYGWSNRKFNTPPKTAIDNWLNCNKTYIAGYETTQNQCAIWKKE